MAFGALRAGTFSGQAASTPNNFAISGSQAVTVGDLIFAFFSCENILTPTAVTDNLGNTWSTAVGNYGSGGFISGRAWYSRVTVAGTLTTLTFNSTSASDNCVGLGIVIEGLFDPSPLDKNPGSTGTDLTSPFTGPATGTLSQAEEVIICYFGVDGSATYTASAPLTKALQLSSSSNLTSALGYALTSATTSIAPAFTGSNPPNAAGIGSATFKKALSFSFVPAAGALALSGDAPTRTIYVPVSLTAATPFRTRSPLLIPTPAFLVLAPGDLFPVPPAASLSLQAQVPTSVLAPVPGRYMSATANLSLQGQTPNIQFGSRILVPGAGSMLLTPGISAERPHSFGIIF